MVWVWVLLTSHLLRITLLQKSSNSLQWAFLFFLYLQTSKRHWNRRVWRHRNYSRAVNHLDSFRDVYLLHAPKRLKSQSAPKPNQPTSKCTVKYSNIEDILKFRVGLNVDSMVFVRSSHSSHFKNSPNLYQYPRKIQNSLGQSSLNSSMADPHTFQAVDQTALACTGKAWEERCYMG